MRARRISAAIVIAAATIAYAAVGGLVQPTSEVVITTAAQGSTTLANQTSGNVTVSSIARIPCDDLGMTVASPTGAFTLGSGSQQAIVFDCPATSSFGMRRCTYHAQTSAMAELASFMGVCESAGTTTMAAGSASIDFPAVVVGTQQVQTVTIANAGSAALGLLQLQTTDLDGNILIGAPCNPNANGCDVANTNVHSFDVEIVCRPSAAATFSGQLHVVDDAGDRLAPALPITCTGVAGSGPAVHVSTVPAPLDLGRIEVLGGSAAGTVRIANVGPSGTLAINSIVISGAGTDWTYTLGAQCAALPCQLGAGEQVDVAVRLAPSAMGTRNATMTIATSDPANSQVAVRLYGLGQGATLELAPGDTTAVDLGQVPKNGSASFQVHFANHGNRDVSDVNLTLTGAPQITSAPAPTTSFTVARGAAPTAVTLTCVPGGITGSFAATLTASATDTLDAAPITVTATCRASDSQLGATPTSLALGEVRTGTSPAPSFPFAIDNLGSGAISLAQAPAISPAVGALSISGPASLAIAGNGSAQAHLDVGAGSDGDLATSITAADSSGNNTVTIPVTGTLVTVNDLAPTSVDLGTFCVNEPTTATAIALALSGTGSLKLTDAHMAAAPSQFELAPRFPSSYPAQLTPGASAVVDVSPRRAGSAAMAKDDIVWATDFDTPRTSVTAQFLAAGAAIAPANLAFGVQSIHIYVKNALPVTIQNCSGPTLLLHPSIDPPFSVDSDFPSQLAAAETATFAIGFHPTKQGMFTGHLHITTSANQTLDVVLSGIGSANGTAPPDAGPSPETFHETSFYACSCTSSGPGGVLPVAFALVCVLCPRRRRRGRSARLEPG